MQQICEILLTKSTIHKMKFRNLLRKFHCKEQENFCILYSTFGSKKTARLQPAEDKTFFTKRSLI